MFAQINEEFIFQFNYILFVMIRLIAFKLLQIKCTALDLRFLTIIKNKETAGEFSFFVVFTLRRCGFAIGKAQFIIVSYQVKSSTLHHQFAILPFMRNLPAVMFV